MGIIHVEVTGKRGGLRVGLEEEQTKGFQEKKETTNTHYYSNEWIFTGISGRESELR